MFLCRSVRSVHFARVLVGFVYSSIRRRSRLPGRIVKCTWRVFTSSNVDSITSSALTTSVSGKAKSLPGDNMMPRSAMRLSNLATGQLAGRPVSQRACHAILLLLVVGRGSRNHTTTHCWRPIRLRGTSFLMAPWWHGARARWKRRT